MVFILNCFVILTRLCCELYNEFFRLYYAISVAIGICMLKVSSAVAAY